MRLQDIAIVTNTPLDTDSILLEKFKAHDRIAWDPKTDLYSYKVTLSLLFDVAKLISLQHEFNFRNKAALLTEIQRQTRKGGGISVRALKESWKEAPAAIEELEKEGEVLVTRTVKDGQLRMVFWNEIKPTEDSGGTQVEQGAFSLFPFFLPVKSENGGAEFRNTMLTPQILEFNDLWRSLKVPNDVDLLKQLASGDYPFFSHLSCLTQTAAEGLQVTNAEAPAPKAPITKKKGKRGGAPRQRQVRITNTHMKGEIDLSKDYVVPGKS